MYLFMISMECVVLEETHYIVNFLLHVPLAHTLSHNMVALFYPQTLPYINIM